VPFRRVQPLSGGGLSEETILQGGAEFLPILREDQILDAPVGGVGGAGNQSAGGEAVDETGDVGAVAAEEMGHVAHRPWLTEVPQEDCLLRCEAEVGGDDGDPRPELVDEHQEAKLELGLPLLVGEG
jgi:hypothetical protein